MTRRVRLVTGALYALSVLGSLSYGAAQVLAQDAALSFTAACVPAICNADCQARGAVGGFCTAGGNCLCVF